MYIMSLVIVRVVKVIHSIVFLSLPPLYLLFLYDMWCVSLVAKCSLFFLYIFPFSFSIIMRLVYLVTMCSLFVLYLHSLSLISLSLWSSNLFLSLQKSVRVSVEEARLGLQVSDASCVQTPLEVRGRAALLLHVRYQRKIMLLPS